jgi:spermidine synthase
VNRFLYLIVTVSGASILAIEILGTRVLGPFYGVSIYLWSALISITLAALSVGYLIGGRRADAGAGWGSLGVMLGAAGIWVLLIPLMRSGVINLASGMGLRAAVLVAATILFAPPLTALGMISPCAIRLKASSLGEVGTTAGDLYAISTIASVAAAVATGFWLVPQLGVNGLLSAIGGALLLTAALCFVIGRKRRPAVLAVLAGLAGLLFPLPEAGAISGTVEMSESPYGSLQVVDRQGVRYLLIDGGTHTILNLATGESLHDYTPVIESTQLLFEEPGRALLVGLGGGIVARNFHESGWTIESVEIDEEVAVMAERHFSLPPLHSTHIKDGRRFLVDDERSWDLIMLDAFGSSSIPFHLVTCEMFELVSDRLTDGGVVAINVECRAWNDPLVHSLAATLRTSFDHVWALPIAEPPNSLGNLVLVASNREGFEFDEDRLDDMREALETGDSALHWKVVKQNHAWLNRFEPGLDHGLVLTDDRSPVEIWSEQINLQARRVLHEHFGEEGRVW